MFELTDEMRLNLRRADLFGDLSEDDFCRQLEIALAESHLKTLNDSRAPIIIVKERLREVSEKSQELAQQLERLDSQMLWRLNDLVSFEMLASHRAASGEAVRWSPVDLVEAINLLGRFSAAVETDLDEAYGSRSSDKAIHDLLDFWESSLRREFSKGAIVKLLAVVSDKSDDAARKLIEGFLERLRGSGEKPLN